MTQTTTKLMVGMTAPTFQSVDLFDQPISLQNYRGRWLLLSFYRNAACAICNTQVHKLISKYEEYHQNGLDMLAVFESPVANMLQYVGKQDAPFPIIADPDAHLYVLYGVETSPEKVQASMASPITQQRVKEASSFGFELTEEPGSNFYRIPADFLIDPHGIIREAFYSELVGEHLDLNVIDTHLKAHATTA
jgi:thioredoxin-dependent peroxiredoxin